MTKTHQNSEEKKEKYLKDQLDHQRIYRSIAGSLIGAGVGYYVTPKMGRILVFAAASAGFKEKSRELYSVTKSGMCNLLNNNGKAASKKKNEDSTENSHYQTLKNDKEMMLHRIQELERKYHQLSQDKVNKASEINNECRDLRNENYDLQKRIKELEKLIIYFTLSEYYKLQLEGL